MGSLWERQADFPQTRITGIFGGEFRNDKIMLLTVELWKSGIIK